MKKANLAKSAKNNYTPSPTHQSFRKSVRLNVHDLLKRREKEREFEKNNNLKIVGVSSLIAAIILMFLIL